MSYGKAKRKFGAARRLIDVPWLLQILIKLPTIMATFLELRRCATPFARG